MKRPNLEIGCRRIPCLRQKIVTIKSQQKFPKPRKRNIYISYRRHLNTRQDQKRSSNANKSECSTEWHMKALRPSLTAAEP